MASIVEEIRNDREKGAKLLESEYKAGLMCLARRFCADESDAEELVNRTFSIVVERIDSYLEQSAFFAWMSRILINCYSKDVRRKSNEMEFCDAELPEDAQDRDASARIFQEVDASILRDAIDRLPKNMKQTLMLHYFMDMPVREVAKVLSVPSGTIMWRLHYARKILGAKLGASLKKPIVAIFAAALFLLAGAAVVIRSKPPPETPEFDEPIYCADNHPTEENEQMNIRQTLTAAASAATLTAAAIDYPIYTVTTSGDGTTNLSAAQVEIVETEGATPTTAAFSDLTLTSGTFRKRGTGYLLSDDAMSGFKGTILIEEGAFIAQKNGHLGPAQSGIAAIATATVVVSNNASLVLSGNGGGDGAFRLGNTIYFRGAGYQNIGAINIALTSSSQNFLFTKGSLVLDADAVIGFTTKAAAYIYYCSLVMNGHTLTAKAANTSSRSSTLGFEGSNIQSPGNIVIDSVYFRPWGDGNEFNGSAANFLTITGGGSGELFPSQHVKPRYPWTLDLTDSIWVERTHNDTSAAAAYTTTNNYGWAGPVRLTGNPRLHWPEAASGKDSFTFLGPVYGTGGFSTTRASRINLVNGNNSFEGEVQLNTYHHGIAELRIFQNGALPVTCAGVTLNHSDLTLMYNDTYHLPALTFDIYTGKSATFSGGTNGTIKSLKKIDSGTLDMTAPLTVTGVTELAGGTLRLPCDRAGLTFGWRVQEGDSNVGINDATFSFTNRVELGTNLAYTDDKVEWQRLDSNMKRLFTYRGYIWNRASEPQNWTFAAQIVQGMQIFIDGVLCPWDGINYWDFYAQKKVGFVTVNGIEPGCHRIDVRIYTTSGSIGYGTAANRLGGADKLVNATWQADLGLAIDRQGRGSTNYADYERLVDPGDGSFLTVVPGDAENAEVVIAHMPKFDHLKFMGGTLDIRGSDITVPVLEGVNGVVTNSNAYFPAGSITVDEKWMLSGSSIANETLKVYGKLKFAAGATLDCTDLESLPHGEYTLAVSTSGIDGMPAFDEKANKGWHLEKGTDGKGNDTIKLFWQLGMVLIVR